LLAAVNVTGVPLTEHRIAVLGGGSAGIGICSLLLKAMLADGLPEAEARSRFYVVDRDGLLVEGMPNVVEFQAPFVQSRARIAHWQLDRPEPIELYDVVHNAHPTVLVGVSGQPGGFPERVVRAMAELTPQPIIFPLSNPTSRAEATPSDVLAWTQGRAVIGTGSPFPPVRKDGIGFRVDQTNNAYVFPGIGLGSIAVEACRISDGMLMAAARALAEASPSKRDPKANLLPPVPQMREVSYAVAVAVGQQAQAEGLAGQGGEDLEGLVRAKMWKPFYRPYRRKLN
jgi:malate dehydrogenase (oxaloacetate-decarboxylating)